MRVLLFLIFILITACKDNYSSENWVKFDNIYFQIEHPEDWLKIDKENVILAISKYNEIGATLNGGNPNLIIMSADSVELSNYHDIKNHEDYLRLLKENLQNRPGTVLQEDLSKILVNNDSVYSMTFKVEGELITFLQTLYHFSNNGQYIGLIATNPFENRDQELIKIMKSLKIKRYISLEKLFENDTEP